MSTSHRLVRSLRVIGAALALTFGSAHADPCDLSSVSYLWSDSIPYSNPGWMTAVADGMSLSALSIPGTHDSGSRLGWGSADGQLLRTAQRLDIATQLDAGVRALDIRLRLLKSGLLTVVHGSSDQRLTFDDVLKQVRDFLTANPGEAVVMRVKEDYTKEAGASQTFAQAFGQYYQTHGDLFLTVSSDIAPTLGQARKKIVVLQDFDSPTRYGIQWGSLKLEDRWQLGSMRNMYDKWRFIKTHLNAAIQGDASQWYVTFLSASSGTPTVLPYFVASGRMNTDSCSPLRPTGLCDVANGSIFPDYPRESAGACSGNPAEFSVKYLGMNDLTTNYLTQRSTGRTGIVFSDFPGPALLDALIKRNPLSRL